MNLDILNADLRPVDTQHAISALRKYLEVMEAQMDEVHRCERVAMEKERPQNADEEDHQLFMNQQQALEDLFEQDLAPAMRYSFVVLMHTVFETRLRAFCSDMQSERRISISLRDLRGSSIEQARTYLTKLVKLQVADFPDWQHLRTLQKVRDCIVHAFGYVAELSKEKEEGIRELASQSIGLTIDDYGRLALTKRFCDEHLSCLATFFHSIFRVAGWKP